MPGIDRNMINQQIANLKASGDYARVITEVSSQVLRDPPDVDAARIAHEAAEQAQVHYGTVTFDFEGVSQHLRNSHQIAVFLKLTTGKGLKHALPVENQSALAKHIVEVSKSRDNAEVSEAFIRENVMSLVLDAQVTTRQLDRETEERLQEEDARFKEYQSVRDISRSVRHIVAAMTKLDRVARDYPDTICLMAEAGELQKALQAPKKAIDLVNERICP